MPKFGNDKALKNKLTSIIVKYSKNGTHIKTATMNRIKKRKRGFELRSACPMIIPIMLARK